MSNVDKVYAIWQDLEDSYQKKGGSKSREEFLCSLLGVKDGKTHTEQLLAMLRKDFVETPESVKKLKFLEEKITAAKKIFEMLSEIEILNLENALIQVEDTESSTDAAWTVDPQEVQAERNSCDKGIVKVMHSGCFLPCTYLGIGGIPESFGLSLERDEGVQFASVQEVTDFVLNTTAEVQKGKKVTGFCASVLAYLVQKIVSNTLMVPVVFVNRDFFEIDTASLICAGNRVYGCTAGDVEDNGEELIKLLGGASMRLSGRTVCVCIATDQLAGDIPLIVTGGSVL